MKSKQTKAVFIALVLSLGFISNFPLAAQAAGEGTTGDYFVDIGTKFGRGLWNTVSSPAEIPCTITADIQNQGGVGFFSGFGKGILFMLRRILVGVTEVGTFIIPMGATIPAVCSSK